MTRPALRMEGLSEKTDRLAFMFSALAASWTSPTSNAAGFPVSRAPNHDSARFWELLNHGPFLGPWTLGPIPALQPQFRASPIFLTRRDLWGERRGKLGSVRESLCRRRRVAGRGRRASGSSLTESDAGAAHGGAL